jgi:hypothetical protein
MAGTATPIFAQSITTNAVQILPADTTTLKTLVTPPANGCKIESILVTSTDTANKDLQLVVTISSVDYVLATFQCPLNSGFVNNVVTFNALQHAQVVNSLPQDVNGNKVLWLASGAVLKVKALTTVTAAKSIQLIAMVGGY